MPCDAATHWNAMFDMLKFVIEYCEALDEVTGNSKMKLCQFELTKEEWAIGEQLLKVLKVNKICLIDARNADQFFFRFSRM
jgi:phage host-nuclease inhibitor protein Gam